MGSFLSYQMNCSGRSIWKQGLCSEGRHGQRDSQGSFLPWWLNTVLLTLPYVLPPSRTLQVPPALCQCWSHAPRPLLSGSQAGWLPVSACTRREHQLTNAEDDTRLVLSICLVTSSYGRAATGAGAANTASQHEDLRGSAGCSIRYPAHSLHACQQMALTLCSTWPYPGRTRSKARRAKRDLPFTFHFFIPQ